MGTRLSAAMGPPSMQKSKTIAICQSNYIPWKGFFDMIHLADEFILYDDMQYTKRDWRNRNIIKTPSGPQWLTIPVQTKSKFVQKIMDTVVVDSGWANLHLNALHHNYARAAFFDAYRPLLSDLYGRARELTRLSDINRLFIENICSLLNIKTKISWSTDYNASGNKVDRLISLCHAARATRYISGPAAKTYIDPVLFQKAGIELCYMDYSGYPTYSQLFDPFDHAVTIFDLILNEGPASTDKMKTFSKLYAPLTQAA